MGLCRLALTLTLISWLLLAPHLRAQEKRSRQQNPTSKEQIPQFPFIGVESGDGAMAMTCEGKAPYATIRCSFLRLDISRKSAEDTKKATQEGREFVAKMSDAELKTQAKQACDSVKASAGQGLPAGPGSGTRRSAERSLESLKTLCACQTKECMERWLLATIQDEARACTIATQQFSTTFRRSGKNKWISTHGPEGLCNLVTVQTIEHEPDTPVLWTFTQTTPTGDVDGPLCKQFLLNKPERFSWKFPTASRPVCEEIDFMKFQ